MTQSTGRCRAHTNIALIKYWGKQDEQLFLPMNSSLSLTLNAFYTDTKVTLDKDLNQDIFFLNHQKQSTEQTLKISNFLDLFRHKYSISTRIRVESINHVPTAAGLASSASAFAALAGAINEAARLNIDLQELSTFSRRGSGSATRSIFGGFVEWKKGTCNEDSFAVPLDDASWGIGMLIVVVNHRKKTISSRQGMKQTVATSPFYPAWVKSSEKDLVEMKKAIVTKDFSTIGKLAESSALKMHATMLGAQPPFTYFEPDSIRVIQRVQELRKKGLECYLTMDAGPNVKILCRLTDMDKLKQELATEFSQDQMIISGVGSGIHSLSEDEWLLSKKGLKS